MRLFTLIREREKYNLPMPRYIIYALRKSLIFKRNKKIFAFCRHSSIRMINNSVRPVRPVDKSNSFSIAENRSASFYRFPLLWRFFCAAAIEALSDSSLASACVAQQSSSGSYTYSEATRVYIVIRNLPEHSPSNSR